MICCRQSVAQGACEFWEQSSLGRMRGWSVVPRWSVWYLHPSPLWTPITQRKAKAVSMQGFQTMACIWSCPGITLRLKEKGMGCKSVRLTVCSENGSCLESRSAITTLPSCSPAHCKALELCWALPALGVPRETWPPQCLLVQWCCGRWWISQSTFGSRHIIL